MSYLVARAKGVDLRQQGTQQVGGGNLWRMTSWKLALPIGIFDFAKGALMVWLAALLGLTIAQQMVVGLAVIIGHNWPIFLRFHGGRGVGTLIGIFTILPLINDMTIWPTTAFWSILIVGRLVLGSSPLPVLAGIIAAPVLSAVFREPVGVTLGFIAIALIIVLKRLTAQPPVADNKISTGELMLNRFLLDRDIRDKKLWMYRKPSAITRQGPWED